MKYVLAVIAIIAAALHGAHASDDEPIAFVCQKATLVYPEIIEEEKVETFSAPIRFTTSQFGGPIGGIGGFGGIGGVGFGGAYGGIGKGIGKGVAPILQGGIKGGVKGGYGAPMIGKGGFGKGGYLQGTKGMPQIAQQAFVAPQVRMQGQMIAPMPQAIPQAMPQGMPQMMPQGQMLESQGQLIDGQAQGQL